MVTLSILNLHPNSTYRYYISIAGDTLGDSIRRSGRVATLTHFVPRLQASLLSVILKSHVIKIAQPDWLTHLVICCDWCRKSQEQAC